MADEPKKSKRRLRPAASETVRQRTVRVQNDADKPNRAHKARNKLAKPMGPLAKPLRPVGKAVKKASGTKPVRILSLVVWPPYLRNAWHELLQVKWPNFKESVRLTSAVLIFAVIFGLLIAVTDYGLDKVFKKVILKQ